MFVPHVFRSAFDAFFCSELICLFSFMLAFAQHAEHTLKHAERAMNFLIFFLLGGSR